MISDQRHDIVDALALILLVTIDLCVSVVKNQACGAMRKAYYALRAKT